MSTVSSCIWLYSPLLVALFGSVVELSGGVALLQKKHITGKKLWELIALPSAQFSLLFLCEELKCDLWASCSCCYALSVVTDISPSGTISPNELSLKLSLVTVFARSNKGNKCMQLGPGVSVSCKINSTMSISQLITMHPMAEKSSTVNFFLYPWCLVGLCNAIIWHWVASHVSSYFKLDITIF